MYIKCNKYRKRISSATIFVNSSILLLALWSYAFALLRSNKSHQGRHNYPSCPSQFNPDDHICFHRHNLPVDRDRIVYAPCHRHPYVRDQLARQCSRHKLPISHTTCSKLASTILRGSVSRALVRFARTVVSCLLCCSRRDSSVCQMCMYNPSKPNTMPLGSCRILTIDRSKERSEIIQKQQSFIASVTSYP